MFEPKLATGSLLSKPAVEKGAKMRRYVAILGGRLGYVYTPSHRVSIDERGWHAMGL